MKTDLDTKLTTALRDVASTTTVSDDALATILRRAEQGSRPPRRRRRLIVTGVTVTAVAAGAGATYAAVTDRLSADQTATVEESRCDINSGNARLAASTTSDGRTVEYWTVDGADHSGDFLFANGDAFGGGACGPRSRAATHPNLPWANFTMTTLGDGVGHFVFFGQAPAGTAAVDLVTESGTTHATVSSPEGYFVAIAELPVPASDRRDVPPPRPQFHRVVAYAADGTVLGTGGES